MSDVPDNDVLRADVIIAGAGLTGATLGLALASAGLKAILVDPQPFEAQIAPTFDGRASAIAFSSFRQWRALGLGEALAPQAQRIEQILVTDGRGPGAAAGAPGPAYLRFDAAEIAERAGGEPLGYMLENRVSRAALAEAVGRAGLDVLAPARVAGVTFGPAAAEVALADGRRLTRAAGGGLRGPRLGGARGGRDRDAGLELRPERGGRHRRAGARPSGRRLRVLPAERAVRHPAADRPARQPSLDRVDAPRRGAARRARRSVPRAPAAPLRRLSRPRGGGGSEVRLSAVDPAGGRPRRARAWRWSATPPTRSTRSPGRASTSA